jgi:hypothetical protein
MITSRIFCKINTLYPARSSLTRQCTPCTVSLIAGPGDIGAHAGAKGEEGAP